VTNDEWRQLLRLLLAQRLELNAIETAMKNASILTRDQIREIRTQAADTAAVWSSRETDDVLKLIAIHASPNATMGVPSDPGEERA